jgi:hypothetical protein
MRPAWNDCNLDGDTMRGNLVPAELPIYTPRYAPSVADLIALALEHRIWAERSMFPEEQRERRRVADIYEALATLDFPMSTVAEVAGRAAANCRRPADTVE